MNKVGKLNAAIYRNLQRLINKKLKENQINIGAGQSDLFFVIGNKEGRSQQELTEHLMVDKSTTTRVINNLQKKGYVKRKKDEDDGRMFRIYLTKEGREIHKKVAEIFEEVMDLTIKGLTKEESKKLMSSLDMVLENVLQEVD